jgi:hypothetical protein
VPDYYDAHTPYLQAVADALASAGLDLSDWFSDPSEPRTGFFALDRRDTAPYFGDEHDVVLLWTEEYGWSFGLAEPDRTELWSEDLPFDDVLPTPEQVVTATRQALVTRADGLTSEDLPLRYHDEDDGFEARLATYHPH